MTDQATNNNTVVSGVSTNYISRCLSFDQIYEQMEEDKKETKDFTCGLNKWNVRAKHDGIYFTYLPTSQEYKPTKHTLNLMCRIYEGLSSGAVNSMGNPITKKNKITGEDEVVCQRNFNDYSILADYIKQNLFNEDRVDQEKNRLFRTNDDGTIRAILSDKYKIIDNRWFIDVIKEVIPEGLVSHWKGDNDTIYGNVLIPDTIRSEQDSDLGGMISIGNSEIGTRTLSSMPSVFRSICWNGCILGQQKMEMVRRIHKGNMELCTIKSDLINNITSQIPLIPKITDQMLSTRSYELKETGINEVLAQLAIDNNLSKKQVGEVYRNWQIEFDVLGNKQGRSAYGLIGAITRAGQVFDNDTWLTFDYIGGHFASMDRNQWDGFLNRANNLNVKQVDKRMPSFLAG